MRREELLAYLDGYLEAADTSDFGPNGLQVEGRDEVHRVVTGVTACRELIEAARARGADALLVHHGIFWDGMPYRLVGMQYRRVASLVRGEINLFAYHLPLDRHPEIGNNVLAARGLGLQELAPLGEHGGLPLGFRGRFPSPVPATELAARCHRLFGQAPLHLPGGPDPVATLGVISGGAQKELYGAAAAGLDAFLTGEASEWVTHVARECGIHYLACGHHATERLGVRALGQHLGERFGLEVDFIDVPNPV